MYVASTEAADGIHMPELCAVTSFTHPPCGTGQGKHRISFFSWNRHVSFISDVNVFSQDLQEKKSLTVLEMLENVPNLSSHSS